jgi:hypothetical protein
MESITVTFRDGRQPAIFKHEPRAGGSYQLQVRYEQEWVVVMNEWGDEHAFPADMVADVISRAERRW